MVSVLERAETFDVVSSLPEYLSSLTRWLIVVYLTNTSEVVYCGWRQLDTPDKLHIIPAKPSSLSCKIFRLV